MNGHEPKRQNQNLFYVLNYDLNFLASLENEVNFCTAVGLRYRLLGFSTF